MASKIILKKSSVAAKAPVAGDLDFGELAINYTDSKLYFKKADGSIDAFTTAAASAPVTSVGGNIGDITDAQLLASIKNVDGAGSGLDADFLDGNHASAFYLASNPNGYTSNTGTVTSVGATAPLVSSGGTTPLLSIPAANSTTNGYMSSAYASKLDGIAAGATNITNTNQLTNGAGYITSSGSISGNAATSSQSYQNTDPTSSTYRILLGNGTNSNGPIYNYSALYWNNATATIQGANISGNAATATSADQIDGWAFRNTGNNSGVNADTIESNGVTYYNAGVTNFTGNATDGALYSQAYSSSWQHQIAGDYRSGQIAVRGKNSGTWQSWRKVLQEDTWQGSKYFGSNGAIYGTIFYDSNNSGYYVDPNGSSRLATVNADTLRSYNNIYLDNQYGSSIIGVYSSVRYQGVFSMGDAYKLALDGTTTGNLYGMAWSHPNAGGIAGNLNTHGLLVLENGGFLAAVSGSIRSRDDMRSPIFYDSNNTGYYCDPTSTSYMSTVHVNNWFRPRGTVGVYWEDYGRGITVSDYDVSYGNITTYGSGRNGWRGYGVYPNNCILMANGANWGMYNPQWGWMMISDMVGNVTFGNNVTAYSDLRLKQNIREIDNVISRRDTLAKAAIKYERDGRTRIGYGAQTLQDNGCSEFVLEADDALKIATGLGTLSVDYGETTSVLAVASKMADDKIAELELKVKRLEALVAQLIGE